MDADCLLKKLALRQALGAAQRAAFLSSDRPLPERIEAQRTFCAAIDRLLAHEASAGLGDVRGTVETAVNEYAKLADLHVASGDDPAAGNSLDRACDLARRFGDVALQARVATDQAFYLGRSGRPALALAMLLSAEDALIASPPSPTEQIDPVLKVRAATASFLRWHGDFERCEDVLIGMERRLLDRPSDGVHGIFRSHGMVALRNERMMLALDRAEFATGDERMRLLAQARTGLDALTPAYDRLGPAAGAAMRFQACRVEALSGHFDAALKLLDALLPTFDGEPDLAQKRGLARVHRARWLIDMGRGIEALADAQAGVAGEEAFGQRETIWRAWWQLARAHAAAGQASPATEAFDRALAALDHIRTATLGYRLDNLALRPARQMVEDAIAHAARCGDGLRAARYADAVKSRFLSSALRAGPPRESLPEQLAQLDALAARIETTGRERKASREWESALAERAKFVERSSLDRGLQTPGDVVLDFDNLLAGLASRRQSALQMFLGGSVLTVVLLWRGEIVVRALSLSREVMAALKGFESNLLIHPDALQHEPDYDPANWALDMSAFVPAELLERALEADALLICPHGRLNLLPWAAMPHGNSRLFEYLPVGVLPNLACIESLAERRPSEGRIALMGHGEGSATRRSLPAVDMELAALAKLYGPRRLVGELPPGTSLQSFRTLLADPRAEGASLHLACHGSFLSDDPAGAALHLADRQLTAAEIALQPLHFREVTLSACSTGLRPSRLGVVEMLGDDLVGLPASFLGAGASTVLTSLMPVDDGASADLLARYHGHRLDGLPPLMAFAQAQRALLGSRQYALTKWLGFSLLSVH